MPSPRRPVLRWSTPIPSATSTPPSPALRSLSEAMTEPIRPPQPARLPPLHFRHTSRPPPFLDSLTRSTLPTSSLSPPPLVSPPKSAFNGSSHDVQRPPPIVLNQAPLNCTSLDSLRSVHRRTSLNSVRSFSSSGSQTSIISVVEEDDTTTTTATSAVNWSWWFNSQPKNLLSEEDRPPNATAAQQQAHLDRKYKSTKNPIVFCHGLLGFDTVSIGPAIAPLEVTHWRGIKEVLEQNGNEVLITRVPATSSPIDRAKVLEEKISAVYPGRSVHLIGHSMGGLDCRYLTTHLTNRTFEVLSVTTIATPHRGSAFADHFLHTLLGHHRLPQLLSMLELLPNGGGSGEAFHCLTLSRMAQFNLDTPDVPGVQYFSWGAVYTPGLIDTWKYPHSVILEKEGPNDGLVSVESAKWGRYLGTLQDVNHLDLVGWTNTARYKWAEIMGKEIKFRPATFYLGIADMLAREVEGQKDEEGEEGVVTEEPAELVEGADIAKETTGKEDAKTKKEGEDGSSSAGTTTPMQASRAGTATPMQASLIDCGLATPIPINVTPPESASQEAKDTHAQGEMLQTLDKASKKQDKEPLQVNSLPKSTAPQAQEAKDDVHAQGEMLHSLDKASKKQDKEPLQVEDPPAKSTSSDSSPSTPKPPSPSTSSPSGKS